jgi:uncharacterized protein YndB with AHSA1/START domain
VTPSPDDDVVEHTLRIEARPETVWSFWTDPERMCEWWGHAAELDPRPGGICRVEVVGGGVMLGRYVEVEPYRRVVFTLGWKGATGPAAVPPSSTRVEVILTAEGDDTVMVLRHTGLLPGLAVDQHRQGWAWFLPLLAAAAAPAPHRHQEG